MTVDITTDLPKAIADQFAACNAHDIDAWMSAFAPGALLNDMAREFIGADAIRAFATEEIFGAHVTMAVHRAWTRHGNVTVQAKLDGTYDKTNLPDPLILTLYFTLHDGLISQLIIIHNKSPL